MIQDSLNFKLSFAIIFLILVFSLFFLFPRFPFLSCIYNNDLVLLILSFNLNLSININGLIRFLFLNFLWHIVVFCPVCFPLGDGACVVCGLARRSGRDQPR
ncbi:hypothetical protein BCR39DRAFT_531666 [Naematelia encephala]|uniref:Transmembrane protein n=1 Tax=Naematelia encephala TaxID=71784 RepID=A0A1Y2B4M9_9TREE|nr:hypothetical protein BCR39DRAFT_531666 [Naematelia encephala]